MGSNKADWGAVLSRLSSVLHKSNSEIVQLLQPGSEMLANLQQEFHTMLDDRRKTKSQIIDIFCFYEEIPMLGVGEVNFVTAMSVEASLNYMTLGCTQTLSNPECISQSKYSCEPQGHDQVQESTRCWLRYRE